MAACERPISSILSFTRALVLEGSVSGKTTSLSKSINPNQKLLSNTTDNQSPRRTAKMPRYEYTNDFRSNYPGRSTVDWMRPSSGARYETVEYAPSDSRGIDPTSFRKNAFSFDTRSGQQPKDYRHYDVHGASSWRYADRDSGYTQRRRDNYGSSNRYGGSSGGDKLSRDAARMRGGSSVGGGYERGSSSSYYGSGYGSRYDSHESSSRSRSGFADFLRSSSSARRDRDRDRDRDYSPARYFGPDDIGRSSSSRSRRPSMGYGGGYDYEGGRGSSRGESRTETITPGGGYSSRERRSSHSSRDRSRFIID